MFVLSFLLHRYSSAFIDTKSLIYKLRERKERAENAVFFGQIFMFEFAIATY